MKEYALWTNSFNEPVEFERSEAIYIQLKRLILLNPGTYPNHPNMGVGLFKKWKFSDMSNVSPLQNEIENQIATYLPDLQLSTVNIVKKENKELLISIQVESISYSFETVDGELKLSDLL